MSSSTKDKCPNILLICTIAARSNQLMPFHSDDENAAYAHLSSLCTEAGMNLYISHFDNLCAGSFVLSWIYKAGSWQTKELPISEVSLSYADLPQNFPNANALRDKLIENEVKIFNDLELSDCLTDKVATYKMFPELIPPTFDTTNPDILSSLRKTAAHRDLNIEKLFLKPRFGERGKGIDVIDIAALSSEHVSNKHEYVVQALLESDAGVPELNIQGRHDLRMLVCNGEVIQLFVRIPAPDSYISNYASGGKILHFDVNRLPRKFHDVAMKIDETLRQYGPRLYSVDAGVGRSGKIWLYELNTMPGIVWESENAPDQSRYKRVHKAVVEMLKTAL